MKRRSFLHGLGVGAAASALATPAIAQTTETWRMVTTWPSNFPALGVGAQSLADRITAATDGRLRIQVFSAGELVPALQSLDAVIDGSAEMSHGAAYYWQNKSAGLNFFTGVPFGMMSRELAAWINNMGGQAIWDEIYDDFGVQGFIGGDTGVQAAGWFRDELTGVDSLKGLRMRAAGLGGRVFEKLGVAVQQMAGGEVFQALQSGTLDAAEFVGPYNDLALGFHQVAKNYYFPSFNEGTAAVEVAINKSKFQSLPQDLQEIVKACIRTGYDEIANDYYANDPRALQVLVKEHGVIVRRIPDEIVVQAAQAAHEVLSDLRESNDRLTKKAAESFFSALTLLRERTEVIDASFLEARRDHYTL